MQMVGALPPGVAAAIAAHVAVIGKTLPPDNEDVTTTTDQYQQAVNVVTHATEQSDLLKGAQTHVTDYWINSPILQADFQSTVGYMVPKVGEAGAYGSLMSIGGRLYAHGVFSANPAANEQLAAALQDPGAVVAKIEATHVENTLNGALVAHVMNRNYAQKMLDDAATDLGGSEGNHAIQAGEQETICESTQLKPALLCAGLAAVVILSLMSAPAAAK
jgi:hypothetical protein